jgi:hypothetical protein
MYRNFKNIFICLVILWPIIGYAVEENDISKYSNYKAIYSLPINGVSTPKIHLIIKAPEGFKVSPENFNAFHQGHSTILEYVPQNETLENWSKIITLSSQVGNKLQADQYTKGFVEFTVPQTKRSKIVTQKTEKRDSYLFSSIAFQYMSNNGKVELLYMEYYSGPYDSSGIHYTVKLDRWLEEKDASQAAKKLEKYISQHVSINRF